MKRALLLLLAGCGTLPDLFPVQDGGQTRVPGTYLDARVSPGHRTHLSLTGEKQLSCHDCHFIADAGFTGNAVKPCAECHEKQQEHHHPFDGGVAMSCFSCHVFRSVGEQARIGKWGCARCHVYDEKTPPKVGAHVDAFFSGKAPPHLDVHVDKCERCHRPHGTPFTKAADCGECHEVNVSHGKGEKALPADTCMTCHPHHSAAKLAVQKCSGCHMGGPVPAKAQVKVGAIFRLEDGRGHLGCSTCHRNHQFTATAAKGCSSCHSDKPVLAQEKHVACITCHRPHEDHAAPKTCESCHKNVHPQHPKDEAGHTCIGCHPPHASDSRAKLAVPCITCHQKIAAAGVVHSTDTDCRACHKDQHAGKPQRGPLCVTCHEKQFTLVKVTKGHAQQACDGCHAGLPHGGPVEPKPCLTCHEKKVAAQKGHQAQLQCASCHQSHSAKPMKQCTDCHNTPEKPLQGLHKVVKHQQCSKCHAPHTPEPGAGPPTCKSCHTQLSAKSHPTPPQQCASCHLFVAPQ